MHHLDLKRTRTKSTMHPRWRLTLIPGSVLLTLTLASYTYSSGPVQVCVPSASPELQLTVESVESRPYSKLPQELPKPVVLVGEVVTVTEPEPEPIIVPYTELEVDMVCQTVWGEARGCSPEEWALVVGCICNRADVFGKSIADVVSAPYQFQGYSPHNPVTEEIKAVVLETLDAWANGAEAPVCEPYATSSDYLYFYGDGEHNWFREEY